MHYEHPIYTPEAVRAQSQLGDLATDRTVYAGAYHGWGFHEDGCRSGVEAARHFGVDLVSAGPPAGRSVPETTRQAPELTQLPALPALVAGWVTHRRPAPVRHAFRHRVYLWLIDLDSVPSQPWTSGRSPPSAVRITSATPA